MGNKSKFLNSDIRLERTRAQHPRARAERVAAAAMAETAAAQTVARSQAAAAADLPAIAGGARVFTLYGAPPTLPTLPTELEVAEVDTSNVALDFYRRRQP